MNSENTAATTAWSVAKSAGSLLMPWTIVGYVWWVGLHWTVIGIAAVYAASLLVAIGLVIGENRRRPE